MICTLQDKKLKVIFSSEGACLLHFENLETGWNAIAQPKLATGVRLLVPFGEYRNNVVDLTACEADRFDCEQDHLIAFWNSVTGNHSGKLNIRVELSVVLKDGELRFFLSLDNESDYVIEEVWYPGIGGIEHKEERPVSSLTMDMCAGFNRSSTGDGFPSVGYWGTDYPQWYKQYPSPSATAPFMLVDRDTEGIYMSSEAVEPISFVFSQEFRPGFSDSKRSRVPCGIEIDGKPCGCVIRCLELPFIVPGAHRKLSPVLYTPYTGSWHKGIDIYKEWRKHNVPAIEHPAWLKEIDTWMTLHIDSPEGCVRYRYDQIADVIREAKQYGVKAVQLIGWADGGQDGNEPYQDHNSRLGTREDLKKAIAEIEGMGVRVLLMCKFKWCDWTHPSYETVLKPHTAKDIHQMPVQFSGYGYQTVLQHLDGGSRRVGALMCQMSPDYQEFADKEFQKLLDLGSSGMLYDELIVNAVSCFDPTHQHEMGECMGKGAVQMAERMYKQAVAHNPEFLMAGEGPFDLQTPYYPINYIRSWNNRWGEWQVRPAWKYLDDTQQIATCITGFDDREMIHQCMAFGYIMNYEPYNFKGKISDFPLTASYGYQATQLRRKLADYLWTGRFMDKLGVSVEVISGGDIVYSNFENRNNGKRAIVIANDHLETPLHCKVKLHGRAVAYDMYTIDRQTPSSVTDMIELPPRSFAVLVEK